MSRDKKRYKRSDANDEEGIKMSPDIEFSSEISVNSGGFQEGDTKCSVKVLGDDEAVPEGSFGAFIAKDRPTLSERMAILEKEMFKLKKHKELYTQNNYITLRNLVAQLGANFEADVIGSFFLDTEARMGKRNMRLHNLHLLNADPAELKMFFESDQYKALNNVIGPQSEFRNIVTMRNRDIHPDSVDIDQIDKLRLLISDGEDLSAPDTEKLKHLDLAFDELLHFGYEFEYLRLK